jgi:methionyl aminopeptidase
MREGGKILATIFKEIREHVKAGMSEKDIDAFTKKRIAHYGAKPTYKESDVNFPGVICISTNDEVVHGVPTNYVLKKGDLVSFDMVITYKDMRVDSGFCMVIDDKPKGDVKRLIDYTERALYAGIDAIKGKTRVGDISTAVEKVLREGKLGIVRELVGHGVGFNIHSLPPCVICKKLEISARSISERSSKLRTPLCIPRRLISTASESHIIAYDRYKL